MKPTVGILQRRLDANEENFGGDEEYEEFTESAIAATSPLFRELSPEEQHNLNRSISIKETFYELIHKPTFTNQLLTIPKEEIAKVLEKIQLLRDNPKTQGNLKKRLHGYQGKVYRLRCGDYRIIYSYGNGWVSLLGVDQRKDVYKGTKLVADSPNFEVNQWLFQTRYTNLYIDNG